MRYLRENGYHNLVLRPRVALDLADSKAVDRFFGSERPQYVFLAAAKVGGILANSTYPADFIRENLAIQLNVVDSAYRHGVIKLVLLGSSCIYPRLAAQPIKEEQLLSGPLEPTNEWYAIAKIAGIKLGQAYRAQHGFDVISLMPANLYGPGDNFDLQSSHVLPALIRKFHEAQAAGRDTVSVWGTGMPFREFLHVDDLASASVFLMQNYSEPGIINVGTGEDVRIAELAQIVARVTGYSGKIAFDNTKPDGTPRKLLDVSRLQAMGWRHRIALEDGICATYRWYLSTKAAQPAAHQPNRFQPGYFAPELSKVANNAG